MKRMIMALTIVAFAIICCAMPAFAAGLTVSDNGDGNITVSSTEPMNGKLTYVIYRGGEAVNYSSMTVENTTSTEIGLPVRRLPYDEYTIRVTYSLADNTTVGESSVTLTTGSSTPVVTSPTGKDIDKVKSVLIPYAKVYANSALTGDAVIELKRHDLVQIESTGDGVAQVKVHIQSGNGFTTAIDSVNAEYTASGDLVVSGLYMSASAFELPSTSYEADLQREVAELAYTRLGTYGVYSQARRLTEFYTDCSALATWLWHQVGIDCFNGEYTSCNGISQWAHGSADSVILWEATEDYGSAYMSMAATLAAHYVGSDVSVDADSGTYTTSEILDYADVIGRNVWDSLEPGDIIFFNYKEDISHTHMHPYPDGMGGVYYEECTIDLGEHFVNQDGSSMGFDHVAVFIGYSSDGNGGVDKNVINVIEASNPTNNTKMSSIAYATSSRTELIKMVVRPIGCDRIESEGFSSSTYSGAFYADIGDLSSPLSGLTASTAANITGGSRFGYRTHPIYNTLALHTGIDLSGNVGASLGDSVHAAADGEVVLVSSGCPHTNYGTTCGCGGGYGNYVVIQHSDSTQTIYAHLQQNISVSVGQTVSAGQTVGSLGSSGTSTGPHLHFEVRYNGIPTDPLQYLQLS